MTREDLARNLEEAIQLSGKTKKALGDALGVTSQCITEYTKGRALINPLYIPKLCQFLDCTYEDIFGRLD